MAAPTIVLRVKRRRGEEAADTLLVEHSAKAGRPEGATDVADSLRALHVGATGAGGDGDAAGAVPAARLVLAFKRVARAAPAGAAGGRRLAASVLSSIKGLKGRAAARDGDVDVAGTSRRRADAQRRAAVAAKRGGGSSGVGPAAPDGPASTGEGEAAAAAAAAGSAAESLSGSEAEPAVRVRLFDLEAAAAAGGKAVSLRRRWLGERSRRGLEERVLFVQQPRVVPNRVLNPAERRMDEAIWRAFRMRDFSGVAGAVAAGAPVNFQRVQSDLTTALMAAAYHGNAALASALVRRGALARITDASGRTAVEYAVAGGALGLASLLRDVLAAEERELAEYAGVEPARRPSGTAAPGAGASAASGVSTDAGAEAASVDVDSSGVGSGAGEAEGEEFDLYVLVDEEPGPASSGACDPAGGAGAAGGAGPADRAAAAGTAGPRVVQLAEEAGGLAQLGLRGAAGCEAEGEAEGDDDGWEWDLVWEGSQGEAELDSDVDDEDADAREIDYPDAEEAGEDGEDDDDAGRGARSQDSTDEEDED